MDFLSRERGQARRAALNETLGNALNYVLGPTGLPERINALGMLNPVNDMEQASQNALRMVAPGATGRERFDAGVGMVTDMATVLAPVAGARFVGGDDAAAVIDAFLGIGGPTREGVDDAARRFAADESGALNLDLLRSRYPGVKIDVTGNPLRGYTVNRVVVPEGARESGTGTAIMQDILRQADIDGATVSLTPSGDFGGNVSRLRRFYEGLGFTPNRGRNRDFGISEEMYRLPQPTDPATSRADEVLGLLRSGRAFFEGQE